MTETGLGALNNGSTCLHSALIIATLLAVGGCSTRESSQRESSQRGSAETTGVVKTPAAPATFVNRVWVVAESDQVAIGELRVFLSDGTLVMTSPHGTPAFGTWAYEGGRLTMTEEGQNYGVDILELTQDLFRIQIHSPGEPVVIRFAPAPQPAVPE